MLPGQFVQVGLNDFGGDKPGLFDTAVDAELPEYLPVLDARAALIALETELALHQGPEIAPVQRGGGAKAENGPGEFPHRAISA